MGRKQVLQTRAENWSKAAMRHPLVEVLLAPHNTLGLKGSISAKGRSDQHGKL
jgi:hypothetical protein